MSILRYTASLDNTITNAFKEDLKTRGTGSNMGGSDILSVFSIYGQATTSSAEIERTLIKFPMDQIIADRASGILAGSGSVNFFLKMTNAPHSETVPRDYKLVVQPVTKQWEEGTGIDMDQYTDVTNDGIGSNWIQAYASASDADDGRWTKFGGDFSHNPHFVTTASFSTGLEDLKVDVTNTVEAWINETPIVNYGFVVRLPKEYEAHYSSSTGQDITGSGDTGNANDVGLLHNPSGSQKSYYTKKFFGRGTEFFFSRPVIEAHSSDKISDQRGSFYLSSALAPAADNLNNLYLYNTIRGKLVNLPTVTGSFSVGIYSGSTGPETLITTVTASSVKTGIYVCSAAIDGDYSTLFDVWYTGSTQFYTGSITAKTFSTNETAQSKNYVVSIPNLKKTYRKDQHTRLKLYVREKNWSPNIYTVAQNSPENLIIEDAIYKVSRVVDNLEVISYGLGSTKPTALSYDSSGNYFDLRMNMLEAGYQYEIKFSFYDNFASSYVEHPKGFKFRVI